MKMMKKFLAALLVLTVVLSCTVAMAASAVYVRKSVHMRKGAGTQYTSIRVLNEGTRLIKLGSKRSSRGDLWYKVQYVRGSYKQTGYVNASYLTTRGAKSKPSIITTGREHLRRSPNKYTGKILNTVPEGTVLTYTTKKKDSRGVTWYRVCYQHQWGWVSSRYADRL